MAEIKVDDDILVRLSNSITRERMNYPKHASELTIKDLVDGKDALRAALVDLAFEKAKRVKLSEALNRIAGGHFEGASTYAVKGEWHAFADRLQEIARATLREITS